MPAPPRLSAAPLADALLAPLEGRGIRLGLEATAAIARGLGDPQKQFRSVLVAGTNGKGSTAAILAEIARAAGLRVGLYTSPHLECVVERVRLDGRAIADERLAHLLGRVIAAADAARPEAPTYFEAMTLAACLAFAEDGVDLAVVEVGLGGRLDATNLCDPALSVVTAIGLDHVDLLGATPAGIAREKAGIFRSGRRAILATQPLAEARATLLAEAARRGAIAIEASAVARVEEAEFLGLAGFAARLRPADPLDAALDLRLHLSGEHQLANLTTAVVAAWSLTAAGWPQVDNRAIVRGVAAARWPGRLEAVELPTGTTVLFDAAHNCEGIESLVAFLDRLGRPFDLLFGAVADKPIEAMLPPLAWRSRRITLTRPDSPRAAEPETLVGWLPTDRPWKVEPLPERALAVALDAEPDLLVAAGSIYLVGALRRALRARVGVPPPV